MGLFAGVLLLLLSLSGGEIIWSADRPLTYGDFRGRIPSGSPWAATTRSTIRFSYETVNGVLSRWDVQATFDPEGSWMRVKDPAVLQHEQLHFDITEVYARLFCAHLNRLQGTRVPRAVLRDLFDEFNRRCDSVHVAYDEGTAHGTIASAQAAWTDSVKSWLVKNAPCSTRKDY
ncbi:MAG: hypothetical protein RMK52_00890 [Chitinophagales bacterium]|nr:hypothetical protein [Chitinophagales bacterium]MDW8392781.1 hypothetical protein [Chitinophagales bacterium]